MTIPPESHDAEIHYTGDEITDPPMLLGGISGPVRTRTTATFRKNGGEIRFSTPEETRYILVQESDGQLAVYRWEEQLDPPWRDIPQIGGTVTDFIDQLEGFGEDETPQAQQFKTEQRRPGTARHAIWSTEKIYQKRGAIRGHHLDHRGGMTNHETAHRPDKSQGMKLREKPKKIAPIGATGFVYDAARDEIRKEG